MTDHEPDRTGMALRFFLLLMDIPGHEGTIATSLFVDCHSLL